MADPTLPAEPTPERERLLAAMDRDIQMSGIPLSYPYRLWMLFVNPLWWVSPGEEPRWTRAEFWRRLRALLRRRLGSAP